jgi:hypothetical protein
MLIPLALWELAILISNSILNELPVQFIGALSTAIVAYSFAPSTVVAKKVFVAESYKTCLHYLSSTQDLMKNPGYI